MQRHFFSSYIKPIITILVGGFLLVALGWLSYAGISALFEYLFYRNDPMSMPQGMVRNGSVFVLCLVFFALMQMKLSNLLKATFMVAPLTMIIIVIILGFYTQLFVALLITCIIMIGTVFLIIYYKKPWYFYFATGLSVVMGILYAWPR